MGIVGRPMPLPSRIRHLAPSSWRDNPRLRAVALAAGVIPPRPMHSPAEAGALSQLARGARLVVELGVYEGSSALVLCEAMAPDAVLHLVDPFVDETGAALPAGWRATPAATRRTVARACRTGPRVCWHLARSQDVGRAWSGPEADLVFVDGDHSERGCREDWEQWHRHVRPGGAVAFHDARLGRPQGDGSPGPTAVVDALFRPAPPPGWRITYEVDTLVVVSRDRSD